MQNGGSEIHSSLPCYTSEGDSRDGEDVGKPIAPWPSTPPGYDWERETDEAIERLEKCKVIKKWVFECDRGYGRGRNDEGYNKRRSKKRGCPVQYHFCLMEDGSCFVGQTVPHRGHDERPDRWTRLSVSARAAIERLRSHGLREIDRIDFMKREGVKDLGEIMPEEVEVVEDRYSGEFRAILCTSWQQMMLSKFGDFVLLESVHSVARSGCNQLTLMVIDEFGRGVPVGYCLATKENECAWRDLLGRCFSKAGRDIKQTVTISDGAMAIVNACRDSGVKQHLLCIFHMLQAIGRKMKEFGSPLNLKGTGKNANDACKIALHIIKGVIHVRSKDVFPDAYDRMKQELREHAVVSQFLGSKAPGAGGAARTHRHGQVP